MSQQILSFDCAHRSLGYTLAQVDTHIYIKLKQLSKELFELTVKFLTIDGAQKMAFDASAFYIAMAELYQRDISAALEYMRGIVDIAARIDKCVSRAIVIRRYGVIDVLGGLNTNEASLPYRSRCLKSALDNLLPPDTLDDSAIILIEDQPKVKNVKSAGIQSQLCMYYGDYQIEIMNPKCKSDISFDDSICYEHFFNSYVDRYDANKMHSTANFIYFIEHMSGGINMLNVIKESNYDDIADSFMQLMVYMRGIGR